MIQLNNPLPVITPKGPAIAHFLIDDGLEHDPMGVFPRPYRRMLDMV